MADIQPLNSVEEWQDVWSGVKAMGSGSVLLFKLSPVCPTSHHAESIFNAFVAALPDDPQLRIVSVDVIAARPASQQIARDTGVIHQSPQAMMLKVGGKAAWHASHGAITAEALRKALSA